MGTIPLFSSCRDTYVLRNGHSTALWFLHTTQPISFHAPPRPACRDGNAGSPSEKPFSPLPVDPSFCHQVYAPDFWADRCCRYAAVDQLQIRHLLLLSLWVPPRVLWCTPNVLAAWLPRRLSLFHSGIAAAPRCTSCTNLHKKQRVFIHGRKSRRTWGFAPPPEFGVGTLMHIVPQILSWFKISMIRLLALHLQCRM